MFAHVNGFPGRVWRHIPGQGDDWIDPRLESDLDNVTTIRQLRDFLDDDTVDGSESDFAIPDRVLEKWGRLFDIVLPSQRRTCCFTRGQSA